MKEILVVTLSNIGDVVLTTPVMAALKSAFPESFLTVVTSSRAHGILQGSRTVDRVVIYDKSMSWKQKLGMILELRHKKYDAVVDLRNTIIPFLVSAKKRSPLFRASKILMRRDKHLEILKIMQLPVEITQPFQFYNAEEEAALLSKIRIHRPADELEPWMVAAPAAASSLKTWKMENYREVIGELLRDFAGFVILAGDKRERELCEPIAAAYPARILNMAGETTLRETAALVARAQLVLTNDSAVMHLGYELERPVAAIFGPTDPEKYGRKSPRVRILREPVECSPCELAQCRFSRQACFEDLAPARVLAACRELLKHDASA